MKTQNWKELDIPLSKPVLETLQELKFEIMTPVQVRYLA